MVYYETKVQFQKGYNPVAALTKGTNKDGRTVLWADLGGSIFSNERNVRRIVKKSRLFQHSVL